MSSGDAFDEEMRLSNRISDAGAERLLSPGAWGADPSDPGEEAVRDFIRALRAELPTAPSEDEAILITRLADSARRASLAAAGQATARIEPVRRSGGWRPRLVLFGRIALAAALAPALLAALAFAGVELPEPAQDAFDRVGIELPNQAGGDEATPQSGKAGDDEDGDGAAGGQHDGESGTPDQATGAGGAPGGPDDPQGKQKGKHKNKKGGPQGGPPGGDPPGQGGTPPGQGGTPPDNGGVPPGGGSGGITGPPPDAGPPSTPPGHGGIAPGQAKP